MASSRKLYRDVENGKIGGVCAGLSDYFDLDVTLIRIIWVLLIVFAGTGFFVYIIMWIVVDPKSVVVEKVAKEKKTIDDDDDPFAKYDK
ncbi:MAG: PspC domain-containing protein [Bacilli bacterium]|nr:PspC domain-containing protein [Bacilli bacterium]MBN2696079.1 PspC domain-containing protein [Bacilli bacterium]